MTDEEFRALAPGAIVRHKRQGSPPVVVTANYGNRVTAVQTFDLTNPTEWEVVCQTCNGRGEVGGFQFGELCPGYVTDPCPDCQPVGGVADG